MSVTESSMFMGMVEFILDLVLFLSLCRQQLTNHLLTMRKLILIALAIPMILLSSCNKEELSPTNNIQNITFNTSHQSSLEFLAAEKNLSHFYDAIIQSKMDIEIDGEGPYTIFAPNNDAFETFFLENNYSSIADISVNTLKLIVQFHVSKRDVKIGDLTKGKYLPILYNERELFIDVDDPSSPFLILGITKAFIVNKDLQQNNGMVNQIDDLLSL